jgi:tetratricopeptide (TPR) repeat protein
MPSPSQKDRAIEQPKRKPHTLPPVPIAPAWTEEITALEKVSDDLAVCLFRALRNVRLWAGTDPERRKALFHLPSPVTLESLADACIRAPQLIEAFGTFAFLLRCPGRISSIQLAEACTQVYEWAEARSLLQTGMHFAEISAVVDPEHPTYAINAGWMCRRSAVLERAAIWYERAYLLAVQFRRRDLTLSRKESIRALVEYGALLKDQGREEEARDYYKRAARRAERTGRRRQAAVVQHYLFSLAADKGDFVAGQEHLEQALNLYPVRDVRIPHLAHDLSFLLVRQRHYSLSLSLLEKLSPVFERPEEQLLVDSTIAWAAAGAGRRQRFEDAESKVLALLTRYEEYAPAALIHLAEGARFIMEWDRAERHASIAVDTARRRQNPALEMEALALLDKIATREPAEPEAETTHRWRAETLVRRLKERLRKWKAPGPGEPEAVS